MAERREQVEAELENIEHVLAELPNYKSLPKLSTLELGGVAALIHNFYNGIENILKLIIISYNKKLPDGSSWHQDLVSIATEK